MRRLHHSAIHQQLNNLGMCCMHDGERSVRCSL